MIFVFLNHMTTFDSTRRVVRPTCDSILFPTRTLDSGNKALESTLARTRRICMDHMRRFPDQKRRCISFEATQNLCEVKTKEPRYAHRSPIASRKRCISSQTKISAKSKQRNLDAPIITPKASKNVAFLSRQTKPKFQNKEISRWKWLSRCRHEDWR